MKTKKLLPILLFLLLVSAAALTVLNLPGTEKKWSVYENRYLAAPPESILDQAQTESYLSDRLFQRERLLRLWTRLNLTLGKPIVNGVVSTDEALLPEPLGKTAVATKNAAELAARLGRVAQKVEDYGGSFLYVHVPEQRSVLRDCYPDWMQHDGAYLDACSEALLSALAAENVPVLDTTGILTREDYYITDHHYTLRGAQKVYAAICAQPSVRKFGVSEQKTDVFDEDRVFFGTYFRELFGVSTLSEPICVYKPGVAFTRYDDGQPSSTPLFDVSPDAQYVPYTAYMGGDFGETILKTDREALPDCLIVGDSFTNPLETLLYQSFNETRSLDFRHYSEMTLSQYLDGYQPEVVIFLRDDVSCLGLTGNGAIE